MTTNEKAFESVLRELESYSVDNERKGLMLQDPLEFSNISAEVSSENMSIISRGTSLNGDINSSDALFVEGKVKGNIKADSDLGVNGLITGDINAKNIHFQSAGVKGNSIARQTATFDKNAVVVGDVTAENMSVDGKIKGAVTATSKLILEKNALISGSITAGNISISDGARINASINITSSEAIDESNFKF